MITQEQMKQLIDIFTAHHVENQLDDIGPNKPDAPFFNRLSMLDSIDETDYVEAAERFHKYKNTQMPYMMNKIGLGSIDIVTFLDGMKAIGQLAKEKESIKYQLDYAWYDLFSGDTSQTNSEKIAELLKQANELGIHNEELNELMLKAKKKYDERQIELERRMTIRVKEFEETWYGKNDTRQRWPKKSKKLELIFFKNMECVTALKSALTYKSGYPAIRWNGNAWVIPSQNEYVSKAIPIFKQFGYNTSELEAITFDDIKESQVNGVSASIEGDTVVLKWPWINDEDLRLRVMSIVKGVMGRKWDGGRKAWLIPLSQAVHLQTRLVNVYPPLAKAISGLPNLDSVLENTAETIAISSASKLDDEDTVNSMSERLTEQFPEGYELYPFQYVGVRFAELTGGRCLIGDDMGVGKTIQAIAYTALHDENHPVLVVCPANVKYNWLKEYNTWLPELDVVVVKKGKEDIPDSDVVIINYDLMSKQKEQLLSMNFNIVVFDESHYLKNPKAQRTKASLEVGQQSKNVLCLSGTAITNRPIEFFTTLNLIRPSEFGKFFPYAKRYCDAEHNGWGWNFNGSSNEKELHERTRSCVIRRLKKEVLDELPDKVRQIVDVHPTLQERKQYNDTKRQWINQYQAHKANGSLPAGFVLNMLTELRHHCGVLKITAATQWIKEYHDVTGKPLVVFAHHKDVIEALGEELLTCGKDEKLLTIGKITGSVSAEKRQERVEAFQAGEIDVLICSTVAAKEGLTLTKADTVVFIEREWSPAWEEQAEDRVNRIGQVSQSVHAVYLSVAGTIDERFNAVIEEKRKVVQAVLDGGDIDERKGIANALLRSMVDSGDLPADLLKKVNKNKKGDE
tara:strand:- start:377 stop:2935 length:2559 start_codon:yes stop_codon:yes gene_type:complete